ncbi:hypothetical protein HYALB_00007498 [Hymenoscyphus albidus]|uniref:Uncharacterized protein n=1 Tax=Hymenoscyphus albidus TaxID=595503 RepID=A0A9N9M1B8_9HELO|nr:hypothetical protein HYALB_00007498 [Hymenoscyphus albidus]
MPYPNPIFKLGLKRLTPGLHLDLTKETPGLLTYCQTLTNTTLPQTLHKLIDKTPLTVTTTPKPIILSIIAIIALHNALCHKKRENPLPCSSLRQSINYLDQRIGTQHYMHSEITRREFEGRYERVVHHDDWNAMTRTITIVEKLTSVSNNGIVCAAWKKTSDRDNTHGECSDDAGVLICCNSTRKKSEYVEVEKVDIDQLT